MWPRRLGWFVGLWVLGVIVVGTVSLILEFWIRG
jgi:hypothetical protein